MFYSETRLNEIRVLYHFVVMCEKGAQISLVFVKIIIKITNKYFIIMVMNMISNDYRSRVKDKRIVCWLNHLLIRVLPGS